jgi:hypothetical protein
MHWYWWLLIAILSIGGLLFWAFVWMANDIGNPK